MPVSSLEDQDLNYLQDVPSPGPRSIFPGSRRHLVPGGGPGADLPLCVALCPAGLAGHQEVPSGQQGEGCGGRRGRRNRSRGSLVESPDSNTSSL